MSTDSGQVAAHEVVLAKPQQDVGLAHPAVPYYQQLRQVVVPHLSLHQTTELYSTAHRILITCPAQNSGSQQQQSLCGCDGLGPVEVVELPLLALVQQLHDQLPPVLQVLEPPLLLLVGELAPGLHVEQGLVELPVLPVEGVVAVPFLEETAPLGLEVLLGVLGALLLDPLLAFVVLLGDVGVLPEPVLVVLLAGLDLPVDVFLPAAAESLELPLDLLLLQLLPVLLDRKLLLEPPARVQLPHYRAHFDNKFYQAVTPSPLSQLSLKLLLLNRNYLPICHTPSDVPQPPDIDIMQREEFSPDIEVKFEQLLAHMSEKNTIVEEFLRILREICDAELFYSRSLQKFANNISKLIVGKDPLKEVFIIFERAISAKSEQSVELAQSIKNDMIPFIEKNAVDPPQQQELKLKQQSVKDIRSLTQHKLRKLRLSESNYRRSYQVLKRQGHESRADLEERERAEQGLKAREEALTDSIHSYNTTVEEYLLSYSAICEKLSEIETSRKGNLRDAINKFMIFEISCIKNIEYNIPRYMKSLQKMNERLLIQDKILPSNPQSTAVSLATIHPANYLAHLHDPHLPDPPTPQRLVLDLKKSTPSAVPLSRYHNLVQQLYPLLDQLPQNHDFKVLKEVVYFSANVRAYLETDQKQQPSKTEGPSSSGSLPSEADRGPSLLLLDAVMCHPLFSHSQFWNKYEEKLLDIINKEKRSVSFSSQGKEPQVNLSLLAGDIDFLKMVSFHPLPAKILNNFRTEEGSSQSVTAVPNPPIEEYLQKNLHFID